ncbi:oligoribonuclease [Candidatus Woesearchaeota archaeon]|jgi:oligoribonuclease|nr:oligoribonuclease [Candidatus Woesearchaeota archaeon]MBT5739894.1 oligoribonuclease [Candidatus Woesearchaeota archaeon]
MNLVWIDLEMTGLDPDKDQILEIAVLITDKNLNVIAEGPELVIHQSDETLANMNEWCTEHFTESGLTEESRKSTISLEQAEQQVLEFVKQHCEPETAPLCGNSIWQDRRFIAKYMKKLNEYLHYRIIDVSSIKELTMRWYPQLEYPLKSEAHRALQDIKESIEELKFYKTTVFKQ